MQKVLITEKHLKDQQSDLLYEPFRQFGIIQPTKSRIIIKQALIPKQLQRLQIAEKEQINIRPNIYIILGQKVKTYPAIQQTIAFQLIRNRPQNESIVYKYGKYDTIQTIQSQKYDKKLFRSCKVDKKPQNRINFNNQKQKIINIKKQNQKYNLMSILDGPINYLTNKLTFTCGDCSNQITASNKHQLIMQFDQNQKKTMNINNSTNNNRVIIRK